MEENSKQKNKRVIGIYVILVLSLLRFLVYPLRGAVERQKLVFAEQYESYRIKNNVLARQVVRPEREVKTRADKASVYPYLYEKEQKISDIQVDILKVITDYAQKSGLTVVNFELLEATIGKEFSEVPVLVRLSGKPEPLIDTLRIIGTQERVLNLRNVELIASGENLALYITVTAFRMER